MNTHSKIFEIFKKSSTTYFYSSLFFDLKTRAKVNTLYEFVRVADNFVDSRPQKKKEFLEFKNQTLKALSGKKSNQSIIQNFVYLSQTEKFKTEWIKAFLDSMETDLTKTSYADLVQLEKYVYGSAEVIGLMMLKILKLDDRFETAARYQARSMQYANFIRDIEEDYTILNREYLPQDSLKRFHLKNLSHQTAVANFENFSQFINQQKKVYLSYQALAKTSYRHIPFRFSIAIQTAATMYTWTVNQISQNPLIVFEKKVKPSKFRVILTGLLLTVREFILRLNND